MFAYDGGSGILFREFQVTELEEAWLKAERLPNKVDTFFTGINQFLTSDAAIFAFSGWLNDMGLMYYGLIETVLWVNKSIEIEVAHSGARVGIPRAEKPLKEEIINAETKGFFKIANGYIVCTDIRETRHFLKMQLANFINAQLQKIKYNDYTCYSRLLFLMAESYSKQHTGGEYSPCYDFVLKLEMGIKELLEFELLTLNTIIPAPEAYPKISSGFYNDSFENFPIKGMRGVTWGEL